MHSHSDNRPGHLLEAAKAHFHQWEMVVPGMSTILKEVFLYMSSQDETIRKLRDDAQVNKEVSQEALQSSRDNSDGIHSMEQCVEELREETVNALSSITSAFQTTVTAISKDIRLLEAVCESDISFRLAGDVEKITSWCHGFEDRMSNLSNRLETTIKAVEEQVSAVEKLLCVENHSGRVQHIPKDSQPMKEEELIESELIELSRELSDNADSKPSEEVTNPHALAHLAVEVGASNLEPLIKGKTPDFVKENEKFQETLKEVDSRLGEGEERMEGDAYRRSWYPLLERGKGPCGWTLNPCFEGRGTIRMEEYQKMQEEQEIATSVFIIFAAWCAFRHSRGQCTSLARL